MSNLIVKAALNNLTDIKAFFDVYATKGKAGEVGNPFWSLYQGEDTKGQRVGYNWHLSDPAKSWELLELNLKPYSNTGGTFLLTMSDKAKDNAPSVFKLIDFNPYRNSGQQQMNGINGFGFNGGIGDINKAISDGVELAMLKKELQDYKNGTNQKGIGAVLTPLMSHPRFDPNALMNGVFMMINGLMSKGQAVTNGIPQYTTQTQQEQTKEQGQETDYYEYDNESLLIGLEKIRAKIKGVRTELIIDKIGDMITTMQPVELAFLLGKMGVNMDLKTGNCSLQE